MSVQIFVQARLTGVEDFLATPAATDPEATFIGRRHWSSLLAEVLPRALLAELGLAKILLGASGGDQFFVVLPAEARDSAERFLSAAAGRISELSGGRVALVWAITENLGDWSDVRKRLAEELSRKISAPAAGADNSFFAPFEEDPSREEQYFAAELGPGLRDAQSVGWSRKSQRGSGRALANTLGRSTAARTQFRWRCITLPAMTVNRRRMPQRLPGAPAAGPLGASFAATSTVSPSACEGCPTSRSISSSR